MPRDLPSDARVGNGMVGRGCCPVEMIGCRRTLRSQDMQRIGRWFKWIVRPEFCFGGLLVGFVLV